MGADTETSRHGVAVFGIKVLMSYPRCPSCVLNGAYGKIRSILQVPVTVHREQSMKREDQQDATVRFLLLTCVSTCFGHHYARLLVSKGPVTAFGVLFWFCWVWLVADVGRCVVG